MKFILVPICDIYKCILPMQAYETIDAFIIFLWNKMKVCNALKKQALVLI